MNSLEKLLLRDKNPLKLLPNFGLPNLDKLIHGIHIPLRPQIQGSVQRPGILHRHDRERRDINFRHKHACKTSKNQSDHAKLEPIRTQIRATLLRHCLGCLRCRKRWLYPSAESSGRAGPAPEGTFSWRSCSKCRCTGSLGFQSTVESPIYSSRIHDRDRKPESYQDPIRIPPE